MACLTGVQLCRTVVKHWLSVYSVYTDTIQHDGVMFHVVPHDDFKIFVHVFWRSPSVVKTESHHV